MATRVPVIDLDDFPHQLPNLLKACEDYGCFRIINHKIPVDLLTKMGMVVRSLFELPPEIKRRNTDVIIASGYLPPEPENPIYEGMGIYDTGSPEAVQCFCTQLNATTHQREILKSCSYEMHELAVDVGCKIAKSLGVGVGGDFFKGWASLIRMNKFCFNEENIGAVGLYTHTDQGFLTILQDDDSVCGLDLMDKTGDFIAVDPFPGSLLVVIGDMAKAWSNGRLHNVKHRVVCKEGKTRVSFTCFLLGPKDEPLEAPPELIDSSHPRLYRPFKHLDHRIIRIAKGLRAGQALAFHEIQKDAKLR